VLDLGCGTGRLAEPLARLGHPVTGVDNSPQMLAALRHAAGVCAEITTLQLGSRGRRPASRSAGRPTASGTGGATPTSAPSHLEGSKILGASGAAQGGRRAGPWRLK
jgi:Methyltransferase domain